MFAKGLRCENGSPHLAGCPQSRAIGSCPFRTGPSFGPGVGRRGRLVPNEPACLSCHGTPRPPRSERTPLAVLPRDSEGASSAANPSDCPEAGHGGRLVRNEPRCRSCCGTARPPRSERTCLSVLRKAARPPRSSGLRRRRCHCLLTHIPRRKRSGRLARSKLLARPRARRICDRNTAIRRCRRR